MHNKNAFYKWNEVITAGLQKKFNKSGYLTKYNKKRSDYQ